MSSVSTANCDLTLTTEMLESFLLSQNLNILHGIFRVSEVERLYKHLWLK